MSIWVKIKPVCDARNALQHVLLAGHLYILFGNNDFPPHSHETVVGFFIGGLFFLVDFWGGREMKQLEH